MGNFSRQPEEVLQSNLSKGYVGIHVEQGVPVLDRDLNLLNDLISATVRAIVSRYIGNGLAALAEDGFAIQAIPAANDFRIAGPGACLVGGIEVTIEADMNYSDQDGVPPLTTPTPAQPDPRQDTVYLDVWLAEVDGEADPDLRNDDDVGMQTSVRQRPVWRVRVAEGAAPPAPEPGHAHHDLARFSRPRNQAEIRDEMIAEDLRQTIPALVTLSDVESRLRQLEQLVLVPAFDPSPNQFTPKLGAPGTGVTLRGRNFNIGTPIVRFNATQAQISGTPTATQIVAIVPSMPAGSVRIRVETSGGAVTSDDTFTVLPAAGPPPAFDPSPNQFTPKLGAPGTAVQLFGQNFGGGAPQVRFGTVDATEVEVIDDGTIRTVVPSGASGPVTISVTTAGGTATSDDTFTVLA